MKLYLMRHGEAAIKGDDPKQGLTHQGKFAIENLAKKLAHKFSHTYGTRDEHRAGIPQ